MDYLGLRQLSFWFALQMPSVRQQMRHEQWDVSEFKFPTMQPEYDMKNQSHGSGWCDHVAQIAFKNETC